MTASAGDLPPGGNPVCPRCGTPAGDAVWCEGCGLNLKQQREFPTADAYTAKVRERSWLEEQERQAREQREAEAARKAAERGQRAKEAEDADALPRPNGREQTERQALEERTRPPRRRRWLVAAAVVLVLALAGGVGVFALAGGSDTTEVATEEPMGESGGSEPREPSASQGKTDSSSGESGDEVFFTDLLGETLNEPSELLIFQQIQITELEWQSWGSPTAVGTGVQEASDCDPNCAEGSIVRSDITVTLSDIEECDGLRQYAKADLGEGTFRNPACEAA